MLTPFVDPGDLNIAQLVFNTAIYGYVLYQASDLISSGSELLMLIPAVAGIVGSVVLPVLGAVPDGMMVLFSGVGPKAQETVAVGVGTLAGSTVMLLTFPWFICVMFGRAPIDEEGKVNYKDTSPTSCLRTGIAYKDSIAQNARIMLATTVLFVIIQVPASFAELVGYGTHGQAREEHRPSALGLVCCVIAFFGYLCHCFMDANEDKALTYVIKGIQDKSISLGTALKFIKRTSSTASQKELLNKDVVRLKRVCKPFFRHYDFNHDGYLSINELKPLLRDLGFVVDKESVDKLLDSSGGVVDIVNTLEHRERLRDSMDKNRDGKVTLDEFSEYMHRFVLDESRLEKAPSAAPSPAFDADEDDEEDDVDEMPEEFHHLSPWQQKLRVVLRSFWKMGIGTLLILVFSDPMVVCLNEWGKRIGISAFYVSFVLAPFASNASELLAAYTYAVKKSETNMTTALSTLLGAACMNNTFVFGIFLALMYYRGLAWQFTAETLSMVLVQWLIGSLCIKSRVQTVTTGFLILMLYPACLLLVWFLESVVGLD